MSVRKCHPVLLGLVVLTGCAWLAGRRASAPAQEERIFDAARQGRIDKVRELLATSPRLVRSLDAYKESPLHAALREQHFQVAEILVAKGADVNAMSREGRTPLMFAAYRGSTDMVRLLLDKGANVNAAGDLGTALHWAAVWGQRDVAEVLIARGADLETRYEHGGTPLNDAVAVGYEKVAALLLEKGADVNAKSAGGGTPLHNAVANCRKSIVELLLAKGADIHAKDCEGKSPLQWAAAQGYEEIATLLIGKGAKVDIFSAAALGLPERIGELLKGNPDLAKAANRCGHTPLHLAALQGRRDSAEALLAGGAPVDARDYLGQTPLHWAACQGHRDMAALLLAKGANPNAADGWGATPLHRAMGLVDLLVARGAEVDIFVASALGRLDRLDALLNGSPSLAFAAASGGRTPLHWAASYGSKEAATRLVARGADLGARDGCGSTPLHLAASAGHRELIEFLLAKGADVNALDRRRKTPLAAAQWGGHTEAVALLAKHGGKENLDRGLGATVWDRRAWGKSSKGLQCGLWPETQTIPVPEGLRAQHVAVFLEVGLRHRGPRPLRILPPWNWNYPNRIPADIFHVLGPDRREVLCWASPPDGQRSPKTSQFETVRGRSSRLRVPYDFTRPGLYRISMTFARRPAPEGREIVGYYGGDLEKAKQNPDNVWTGSVTSNTVTIRVVRPGAARPAPASRGEQGKLLFGTDVLRHDQTEAEVPIVPFFRALRADGRPADAAWRKIAWENAIRLLALEPSP